MKKLIIVSTRATTGKGGISTALSGYLTGLSKENIDYIFVESHWQHANILLSWLSAFWQVCKLSVKYRKNAVFWFHLGPWLSMVRKCTLAVVPRLLGANTVGHVHSPAFASYMDGGYLSRLFSLICLLPYKELVVLTPWWKKFIRSHHITKPIFISANPNSEKYNDIAQEYLRAPRMNKIGATGENINILSMARIAEGKNVDVVIKALALLPENVMLTVAGDGPLLNDCKILVQQMDLINRVTFTGWVSNDEKEQLLRNADLFCLPSTYDSFGMVFIEAMAFDLPVIAYGWGPIKDVVTEDVGVCCDQPEVNNVVDAIKSVAANLSKYSGKGPQKVLRNYAPDIVVANMIEQLKLNNENTNS